MYIKNNLFLYRTKYEYTHYALQYNAKLNSLYCFIYIYIGYDVKQLFTYTKY